MVFSSMAADEAKKGTMRCTEYCHKYGKWAALFTGIASGIMIISLVVYIYYTRREIAGVIHSKLAPGVGRLGKYAGGAFPGGVELGRDL